MFCFGKVLAWKKGHGVDCMDEWTWNGLHGWMDGRTVVMNQCLHCSEYGWHLFSRSLDRFPHFTLSPRRLIHVLMNRRKAGRAYEVVMYL